MDISWSLDTFTIGASTYAIVTADVDHGVQIIDVSDPTNIVAKDSETDGANGFTELEGAYGAEAFTLGVSTYAIDTSLADDGVQIIDVSDPTNIVAKDSVTDDSSLVLDGAKGIDTFVINGNTYAIVTAESAEHTKDGVQILELSTETGFTVEKTSIMELSESVSLTDSMSRSRVSFITLGESISLADSASETSVKDVSLTELVSFTDDTIVGRTKYYSVYLRIYISGR